MDYEKKLEILNQYQKEAVLDESDACIVNANVGSGKTTVLISKIIYLHYAKKVSYKDMIVLAFTNKAANEIKERLIASDNSIQMEELETCGTFHSVALHLLRSILPVEKLGYTKDFLVIEPEEELDIAMQIIRSEKLHIKYKNRLKKRLEQAMSIQKEDQKISRYNDDIYKLVKLLQEEKIRQNKMSFSDLLQTANVLLDDATTELKWIIIDEVQDSDKLQLDFIDKLKSTNTRLFAVGDPNQVIYSWRGSALNVFYTLKHKYNAKELSLPINYRSSSSILEAAKCFLQNGSNLTGIREPGNKIVVKNQYNPFNEACYLADKIREIHSLGVPYKEIAIFYRLQNQSQVFEDVFMKNKIPYEVSLKKTIRDIPVLNWMIKLLRFSVNHNDLSSGIYVLSNKDYGEKITEKEAGKIVKEQEADKSELFTKMQEFVSKCSEITKSEELYNYFQFDKYIRPTASTYKEDKDSICTLQDIILEYVKEKQMTFLNGLTDFINSSALYGVNILQKDINSDTDSVKFMTLHASKGLEFSYVFITGVNYGLIPLQTRDMEEEEEEGRLFFVGITRAKDYLELSYYTNPDYYRAKPGESRYIHMIPPHLIQNDAVKSSTTNLQELKKQIQEAKEEENKEETSIESVNPILQKQVSHKKYGIGKVLKEDEMMIEVEFENYGVKEFMKAFSELEFL
ncbi:MAG: ATP-dependent helicase [Clostridium sp.]|uniref:ATP-dependent helicase n=1 Tax=Clostridium sp. TaxID=1506 RepID=UPI0039E9BD88